MSINKILLALDQSVYSAAQQRYEEANKRYLKLIREGHDVVLEPEYFIEVPPIFISAAGSWVYDFMQIPHIGDLIKAGKTPQRKVVVAVIDTGAKARSKYLQGTNYREDLSKSFVAAEPGLLDDNDHFSMVASTMFGRDNTPFGVCWLPGMEAPFWEWFGVKGLNAEGSGSMPDLTKCLAHCLDVKRKHYKDIPMVVNASWGGGTSQNTAFNNLLEACEKEGIFFIAAAGNSNGAVNYPGNARRAFAVSAIDRNFNRAWFSCYGKEIFAAAPGVSVPVANKTESGRGLADGTSFASPITAGMVATLLAYMPEINTPADLREFAREGNLDDFGNLGRDDTYGYGIPRAKNLLDTKPEKPGDPGEEPTEPNPPAPPTDPKPVYPTAKNIQVPVAGKFTTMWKAANEGKFQFIDLQVVVELSTRYRAEDAALLISEATRKFFTNRAFVGVANDDLHRALYWIRHFYEMILKKNEGYDVKMHLLTGSNEAGTTIQLRGDQDRTSARVSGTFQPRTFELTNTQEDNQDEEKVNRLKYGFIK